jgi:uncharacterized membrane protein YeiH
MMAIAAFAMTGVIAISSKGIDLFIACVTGIITAIAGGTVRDLKYRKFNIVACFQDKQILHPVCYLAICQDHSRQ